MRKITLAIAILACCTALQAQEDIFFEDDYIHSNNCVKRFLQLADSEKYAYLQQDDKRPKALWLCRKCGMWNFEMNKQCKTCGARKGRDQ